VIHIHVDHRTHHSDWAERLARGSARPYAPASQGFFGSLCLLSRLLFRLPGTDDPAWPVSVVRDLSRACLYASASLVLKGSRLHPTIQRCGPTRLAQLSDPRLRNHGQPDADMLQVRQSKVICRGRALRCAAAVGHMTVSRRALRCKYRHVSAQVWVQSYIR